MSGRGPPLAQLRPIARVSVDEGPGEMGGLNTLLSGANDFKYYTGMCVRVQC